MDTSSDRIEQALRAAPAPRAPRASAPILPAARADAPRASALIWQAVLLGVTGDALLRDGPSGPGFAIWIAVLSLALVSLTWNAGRRVTGEASGWLATAVLFAAATAWRDAETLRVLDVLAATGALGMAAIALRDEGTALWAPRLRDTLWAAAAVMRSTIWGFAPLALRELFESARESETSRRVRSVVRAVAIASVLLVVFGSLLLSADPIFASFVALPAVDFDTVLSHVLFAGFLTWVAGGWAHGALVSNPERFRAPDRAPFSLGMLDVTTALGTLTLLFAAFALAQLGWLFGGERFLRETTGLTAATYARQGFFQMVWVVVLVVPVLLATRAMLAPGAAVARRHTMLAIPVVALLGAIILSAVMRMRMYVEYYGLTTDRLSTLVFMGWLAIVLVLFAATVLRDRGRLFVAGSIVSALVALGALHLAVPDVVVARVNLARAAGAASDAGRSEPVLDLRHLSHLSGDAAALATFATLSPSRGAAGSMLRTSSDSARCDAAVTLLRRWGPASETALERANAGAWRTWNAGETQALTVVGAREARLRAVQHATCGPLARAEHP